MAGLSSAVINVFKRKNNHYGVDWFYTTCSAGKDLDPNIQVGLRRCIGLRRAMCKRPHMAWKIHRIPDLYDEQDPGNKWLHNGCADPGNVFPDYAPHPSKSSTAEWGKVIRAKGPVGLLIQSIYAMGSMMDKSCKVWSRDEPYLDILNTPYQHVSSIFTELATKARTAARAWTKVINRNLNEIDQWVTMQSTKKLSGEDHAMLRTSHCG